MIKLSNGDLDVLDGRDLRQQPVQGLVGEQQRVAAREQDVAHPGRGADVFDAPPQVLAAGDGVAVADLALARAVAAVHGASVADVQQDAVRVAVGQAGHG
jgi:hypothetical protein